MKTVIEMARDQGLPETATEGVFLVNKDDLGRFAELVRADEREQIDRKIEEFARKWWKIHCDSNLHYSSTLKAHQNFCALQAAIRARGTRAYDRYEGGNT